MKRGTYQNEKRAYKGKEALVKILGTPLRFEKKAIIRGEGALLVPVKGHYPEMNRGSCEI